MAWLLGLRLTFLLLIVAGTVGAQAPATAPTLPPRTVKCNNKTLPACYKRQFTCPSDCPQHCLADCDSCQAICRPNKVRCQYKKAFPECGQQTLRCPATCPTNCHVNCVTCQPVCGPAPPPPPPPAPKTPRRPPSSPPPPSTNYPPPPPPPLLPPPSGPLRVTCKNTSWPHCYGMTFNCPSACPDGCGVDCITCKAVCGMYCSSPLT